jgi:TRAP-type C4-dicarboxylate transport system substrate-binding protein
VGARALSDAVLKESGGEIVVEQIGSGDTPGNDLEAALRDGIIDMAVLPSSSLADRGIAAMAVFDLPFIVRDMAELADLEGSAIGITALGALEPEGVLGLAFWNHGFSHLITAGPPIRTANDLKGRKIATRCAVPG